MENTFQLNDHIVGTYVFHWYTADDGQMIGPWVPLEGREAWSGEPEDWKPLVRQMMVANIDIVFVHLIDSFEPQRSNLFRALAEMRAEGVDVPQVAPFLDPEVTWHEEPMIDLATEPGRQRFADQYVRFFRQYFAENTDEHAADGLAHIDGRPVLSVWHMHLKFTNLDALTRDDLERRLQNELEYYDPSFAKGVYLITQHAADDGSGRSLVLDFADERVHQFDDVAHYVQRDEFNGVGTAQIKPGYWDQNVRTPGAFLPRRGGAEYAAAWRSIDSDAVRRVYIESFNEYDEGTGIYAVDASSGPRLIGRDEAHDEWSRADDPWEYIRTTAAAARLYNEHADFGGRVVGDDLPERVAPADELTVSFLLRNEGDEAWSGGEELRVSWDGGPPTGVRIGYTADERDAVRTEFGVVRGDVITVRTALTAPTTAGQAVVEARLWSEARGEFGEPWRREIIVDPAAAAGTATGAWNRDRAVVGWLVLSAAAVAVLIGIGRLRRGGLIERR